jgi:hypothetical protein
MVESRNSNSIDYERAVEIVTKGFDRPVLSAIPTRSMSFERCLARRTTFSIENKLDDRHRLLIVLTSTIEFMLPTVCTKTSSEATRTITYESLIGIAECPSISRNTRSESARSLRTIVNWNRQQWIRPLLTLSCDTYLDNFAVDQVHFDTREQFRQENQLTLCTCFAYGFDYQRMERRNPSYLTNKTRRATCDNRRAKGLFTELTIGATETRRTIASKEARAERCTSAIVETIDVATLKD